MKFNSTKSAFDAGYAIKQYNFTEEIDYFKFMEKTYKVPGGIIKCERHELSECGELSIFAKCEDVMKFKEVKDFMEKW